MSETVGFIGVGDMGRPMAARLAAAGYTVRAFDIDPARAGLPGLVACASVAEACAGAAIVVSLVRTLPQTQEVVAEVEGAAALGTTVVLMSTINPSAMAALADRLGERGLRVLDAPVSGGTAGAEAGTLAIMVGGAAADLERVRPLLEVFGSSVFHVGERPGDGQALKLANQLMLCVNMLGAFEALKLAGSYGLPPEQVLPVIGVSTGMSWVSEHWDTVRGWWEGHPSGGALDIVYKDLRSLLGDAADRQLSYPVAALAFNLLREVW
jgi:3-hydroxyisobutyrate dehydrogenase-like beta-hydroxyacid dehydrogenase